MRRMHSSMLPERPATGFPDKKILVKKIAGEDLATVMEEIIKVKSEK